ncbi:MAG: hypothetical protein CMO63_03675 [Verrucomicrobiales bacterium]|nr:hypothetical protein [Verrucomicrobiales bacterium]
MKSYPKLPVKNGLYLHWLKLAPGGLVRPLGGQDGMSNLTTTCLGTGDGHPSGSRAHSAFLYEFPSVTILLDCGEPVTHTLTRRGVHPDAIDHIFLSHLHSDHLGGFFMLMQGLWLRRRQKPLTVFLPEEGIKPVQQLLCSAYLFPELMPFKTEYKSWTSGQPCSLGPLTATPFNTTHLEQLRESFQPQYPQQAFEAFSFTLETGNTRAAHSADIGHLNDLDPLVTKPLDLLVCELAHVEPADLFEYLAGRNIGQILFTHVAQGHWEDEAGLRQLARDTLGGMPHEFATDGTEVAL